VLGDLILDIAAQLGRPVAAGSDTPGTIRFRQGGSAANTARRLARLGVHTTFIGAVGRDRWAGPLTDALRRDGVRLHIARVAGPTARLVALIAPDGERSFVTDRAAADGLTAAAVRPAWLRGADVLHVPAYSLLGGPVVEAVGRAVALARGEGARLSIDLASAAPLLAAGSTTMGRRIADLAPDLLFGNLEEAAAMTGSRDGVALLELAPLVVVKAGPAGCLVLTRDGPGAPGLRVTVPARVRPAADTTGAGDAFDAGFLAAWTAAGAADGLGEGDLRRAARAGHRAAQALLAEPRSELRL
jgi:sugar/nucleoside kinase (ribokinase family)